MYFVYSLLLTFGFVILLPRFVLDALRSGKYVTGLRQRLGNISGINPRGKPVIWLHCVSVGEAQAAQSLIRSLSNNFPNFNLAISTTTVTGQQIARHILRDQAPIVFYFPIDWAWTVRRVLRTLQPAAILVMETEIWPRLFREARQREVPVALINGRISDKSFRRYKLIRSFMARVLNDLTLAAMQTETDAARIRELGLPSDRLTISGNLKFDSSSFSGENHLTSEIRSRFGFQEEHPLIVGASTHNPEEALLLDAFKRIRQEHPAVRLLVAPRHPERFEQVASLLAGSNFRIARRSAPRSASDRLADVVLLDSIGELTVVYPLAQIAFVGGSLIPHGGHSVIEPAACGVCTITGPHTRNFAAVIKALLEEDALIQLPYSSVSASALAEIIDVLLEDSLRRRAVGERARAVCERNRGATDRTIELVSQLLASAAPAGKEISFSPLHATAAK